MRLARSRTRATATTRMPVLLVSLHKLWYACEPRGATQCLCNGQWFMDQQPHADKVFQFAQAGSAVWEVAASVPEHLQQLYQVHLWLQDHQLPAEDIKGLGSVLTQRQLKQCRNSWEQDLVPVATVFPICSSLCSTHCKACLPSGISHQCWSSR